MIGVIIVTTLETKITVDTTHIVHKALASFAEKLQKDHGVFIQRVDFDWSQMIGGDAKVVDTNVTTTTRA